MTQLKVPFVKQLQYHCGPASLEMVYKYFELNNASQEDLFKVLPKQIDSLGNTYILLEDLMKDARNRGLKSFQVDFSSLTREKSSGMVKELMESGIPLIALGQWKNDRNIGHFRVIFGISEKHIFFHDPDDFCGKGNTKYTIKSFYKIWKAKGHLPGNLGVVVCREEDIIPVSILDYIIKDSLLESNE